MTPADLRAWRSARGLSLKAAALLLHCAPDTLKSWEAEHRPVPDWLPAMLAALALRDAVRALLAARAGVVSKTSMGILPSPHELVRASAIAEVEAALSAMG
jgi:DNA-binding XRE family transcriptional regulator